MVSEDAIWEKRLGYKNEEKLLIDYIKLYNNGEWGHSLCEKIVYFNEKKLDQMRGNNIKIKKNYNCLYKKVSEDTIWAKKLCISMKKNGPDKRG